MKKCILTALILASGSCAALAQGPSRDLSIDQVQQDLTAGKYTVGALESYYEQRIRTLDWQGPGVHSVIELNPDAASIATKLSATGSSAGALFGIAVLLKDNIDTDDAMHTTAGSLALMDSRPARDAFIVRKLRASGALILGKTNLSEWANFRSNHSSSGWSGRGGQTHNPYALDRNPCGSSSGTGAAIAADFATVGIGTETDGSVTCPSSINALVGLKPTVGLVSRSGIIPISASQDTAGPMARSVADVAALLNVIAGYDADDPATLPLKDKPLPDFRMSLRTDALKGVRVGVLRSFAGFHEETDVHFDQAIATLKSLGAVIIDPVTLETRGKFGDQETKLLQYEFKDGLNRYLATRRGSGPRDLAGLIAYNEAHRSQEMPFFGQDQFIDSQKLGPLSDPEYIKARDDAKRLAGAEGIDATLAKDHLDVLLAPTAGPAWLTDHIDADHFVGGDTTGPPAVAGYPHITVPMEAVQGLPVGLSFIGPAWSDAALIGYAYAYEQATHFRRPPTFARTLTVP
jgi:amidase